MRLVTWNCRGAFARKHNDVATLRPDVLVAPEAEHLTCLDNVIGVPPVRSLLWFGENKRKGLAVVSYGDYSLKIHPDYDDRHRWVIPIKVHGSVSFTLFAVWAMPHRESHDYIQCLFDAIGSYGRLLRSRKVIWMGDFNNNVVFDKPRDVLTFSKLLATFEKRGLRSLYHVQQGCAHGEEPQDTFFLYHHADKGHHIDFVFAKKSLYREGFHLAIGDHQSWSKLSDHMPVVCSFHDGEGDQSGNLDADFPSEAHGGSLEP